MRGWLGVVGWTGAGDGSAGSDGNDGNAMNAINEGNAVVCECQAERRNSSDSTCTTNVHLDSSTGTYPLSDMI